MLYIKDNGSVTISAIDLMILGPMLSGPGDLLFFRLKIIFSISEFVVGEQNMLCFDAVVAECAKLLLSCSPTVEK